MGVKKTAKKGLKKMSKKSLFEEEQQKIKIIICYTEKKIGTNLKAFQNHTP